MIRATGRRLGALFLLTAFLAGGYGLSDFDALLFHSNGHGTRPDVAHLDQPGGCGAHAERCALALSAATPQYIGQAPIKVRVSPAVARPSISPAPAPRPAPVATLQLPRAPPHASAR